jgi:uncharacterized protein (DUF1800 family)
MPNGDGEDQGGTRWGDLRAIKSDPDEVARAKVMRETADTFALAQMSAQVALMLADTYAKIAERGHLPSAPASKYSAALTVLLEQITKFSKLA